MPPGMVATGSSSRRCSDHSETFRGPPPAPGPLTGERGRASPTPEQGGRLRPSAGAVLGGRRRRRLRLPGPRRTDSDGVGPRGGRGGGECGRRLGPCGASAPRRRPGGRRPPGRRRLRPRRAAGGPAPVRARRPDLLGRRRREPARRRAGGGAGGFRAGLRRQGRAVRLGAAPPARERLTVTAPPAALRVSIGEDDVLLREGMARILTGAGLDVVVQSGDAEDLLRRTLVYRPDVAIVDVQMPPRHEDDGVVAALEIRRRLPGTGVLLLSQFCEPAFALQLIGDRPEGVGYLLKERVGDVHSFTESVSRVAAGGSALDPEVVA